MPVPTDRNGVFILTSPGETMLAATVIALVFETLDSSHVQVTEARDVSIETFCASVTSYEHHSINLMLHYLRHPLLRLSYSLCRILVILQFSGKVGIVCSHIKVAMAGQIEQDGLRFSSLFCC